MCRDFSLFSLHFLSVVYLAPLFRRNFWHGFPVESAVNFSFQKIEFILTGFKLGVFNNRAIFFGKKTTHLVLSFFFVCACVCVWLVARTGTNLPLYNYNECTILMIISLICVYVLSVFLCFSTVWTLRNPLCIVGIKFIPVCNYMLQTKNDSE